jgi:hypothetical protein
LNCKKQLKIPNENLILVLPLKNEISVEELLNNYFRQTKLTNLICKSCKSNQFEDKFFIEAKPNFFVLVVERFIYHEKKKSFIKNKQNLKINSELNFGLFSADNNNQEIKNYKLISFIEHLGETLDSGHAIR